MAAWTLPTTATAPFCPAEVKGTVPVRAGQPVWRQLLAFVGPGLLISVGYMDPGNWATDIAAGSQYGYGLLFVVVASSLAGIVLQTLSARLGVASGQDLAQLCRANYARPAVLTLWALAELAIVACDVAEVLGAALALQLLLHLPLWAGVLVTALDTAIVLGLKGRGFRQIEAIVLALVATIGVAFALVLALAPPDPAGVAAGLAPSSALALDPNALYLAVGILGATVMPHNLYLHSSVVQTRALGAGEAARRRAIGFATLDISGSLLIAALINGAILVMAAAAFHAHGRATADIAEAYQLLSPVAGPAAALLFGLALLASGQSSTFTGTIAGQVIVEGFLKLSIPCWQRRLITRALALVPALIGVLWLGEAGVGALLVASQVVLSLQLPFALWPLIRFNRQRDIVGAFVAPAWLTALAWLLFAAITAANLWLLAKTVTG